MQERKRKAKWLSLWLLVLFFFGSGLATQTIASGCEYNPLLGSFLPIGGVKLYWPLNYWFWQNELSAVIPDLIASARRWLYLTFLIGFFLAALFLRGQKKPTSHGSAEWANEKDIETAKLTDSSGVVLGINPFTHRLLRHDGPEHVSLMAPTRSGKGVCVIVPTCLLWKHSIFVTDVKGENWHFTAGYRKNVLKQKVLKFDPMDSSGASARWNPLAEIHFRSEDEFSDIQNIVTMIVDPEGKGQLDYWANTGSALLIGTILHLLYANHREGKPLPTLTDVASFLSSPERSLEDQLEYMKTYPHITTEEFLSDQNILEEIYGNYISNFEPYRDSLGVEIRSMKELKQAIRASTEEIDFEEAPFNLLLTHPRVSSAAAEMQNKAPNEQSGVLSTAKTFLNLYQNPVIEKNTGVSDFCITDLLNPMQEVAFYLVIPPRDLATLKPLVRLLINAILRTLIKQMEFDTGKKEKPPETGSQKPAESEIAPQEKEEKNRREKAAETEGKKEEKMPENKKETPAPVEAEEKKEEKKEAKKQRLLLMLDEFPQFGRMDTMEIALAVCAGYGIKVCVVSQDINQLNKAYTKDNSILSNCHVHVYFTPNLDGSTAPQISKMLGKKTIFVQSQSAQSGSLFKNSTSTSATGRELMTPDEVSQMSSEKELIFVAGHKPILADKLRWYLQPYFKEKIQDEPLKSDTCTKIQDYETLRRVHEREAEKKLQKKMQIQRLKEQQKEG